MGIGTVSHSGKHGLLAVNNRPVGHGSVTCFRGPAASMGIYFNLEVSRSHRLARKVFEIERLRIQAGTLYSDFQIF